MITACECYKLLSNGWNNCCCEIENYPIIHSVQSYYFSQLIGDSFKDLLAAGVENQPVF